MKSFALYGKIALLSLFVFVMAACNGDDNDDAGNVLNVSFEYEEILDRVYLWDSSDLTIDEKSRATVTWSSDKQLDIRKESGSKRYYFILPEQNVNGSAQITLSMTLGNSSGSDTRTVPVAHINECRRYGLGLAATEERSNNVSYYWYVDQGDTGEYANINCGPACCEMVGRWARQDFGQTAQQMRTASGLTGYWQTGTITNYLGQNGVTSNIVGFTSFDNLKTALDDGRIAILLLDMQYVRTEAETSLPEWRKDKFYLTNGKLDHFIVVKGYKKVDGEYLLECYDPYSLGRKYEDGRYKGLDRYYRLDDILTATANKWQFAIIVSRN